MIISEWGWDTLEHPLDFFLVLLSFVAGVQLLFMQHTRRKQWNTAVMHHGNSYEHMRASALKQKGFFVCFKALRHFVIFCNRLPTLCNALKNIPSPFKKN